MGEIFVQRITELNMTANYFMCIRGLDQKLDQWNKRAWFPMWPWMDYYGGGGNFYCTYLCLESHCVIIHPCLQASISENHIYFCLILFFFSPKHGSPKGTDDTRSTSHVAVSPGKSYIQCKLQAFLCLMVLTKNKNHWIVVLLTQVIK